MLYYINEVLKNFYLLIGVPVQYFNSENKRHAQYGVNILMKERFFKYSLLKELKKIHLEDRSDTITLDNDIHFTIAAVCPRDKCRGFFVIGPYTSNRANKNIPFKPLNLKKNMISMIRILWRGTSYDVSSINIDDNTYSFHVKKAIDFIDSRYMDDINLDDISNYLGISKPYFCSIFKKETGSTFTEFLNKARISYSQKLLLDKNNSVLDVALSVGFNNQNYYNIVFKKLTGLTPLEYRNQKSI